LDRCLKGIPENVYTTCHICCGYSDRLDQEDYKKAPLDCYEQLAEGLDKTLIKSVSVEDGHRRIPDAFFQKLKKTDIVLGCLKVVRSECFTPEEIAKRIQYIIDLGVDIKRIVLAPDCGLAMLPVNLARTKLENLKKAREIVLKELAE